MASVDDLEELIATRKLNGVNDNLYKEKTSDEMFEELGYKKEEYNPDVIYFTNKFIDDIYFVFNYNTKKFCFVENNDAGDISMQELKAINKKVKELGWLDE